MLKRRLVYLIAGYDPVDAGRHHRRFVRGLATFARTWNVTATASELMNASDDATAHWTVTTEASNWRVDTTYRPLSWCDIVLSDFARPMPRRLIRFGLALFDFVRSATALRYFQASFRYGLFFLLPVIHLIIFAAAGFALGRWVALWWQLQGVAVFLTATFLGTLAFFVLLKWPGRRWRVTQAMDDWIFSWEYLHGRRADMDARLDRFARAVVKDARESRFDEILIVGHSLGATLAINAAAKALEIDPALATRGPTICVLTVGSTIAKFTLHPAADRIRRDVARVAAAPSVEWAEYHARADPISFYKFDPTSGHIEEHQFDRKPLIRLVRIRNMLEKSTYRRIQLQFMRVHHQFVMANERRAEYDFFMMGCGPIPFRRAVVAAGGLPALIGAQGEVLGELEKDGV